MRRLKVLLLCAPLALLLCVAVKAEEIVFEEEMLVPTVSAEDIALPDMSITPQLSQAAEEEYPAGTYEVGNTIPAGEYMLFADDGRGRFWLSGGGMAKGMSFSYNAILAITDGQRFVLDGCHARPINQVKNYELVTDGEGMFKVGMHIPAGTYRLVTEEGEKGFYRLDNSSAPGPAALLGAFSGQKDVRIIVGQYIRLTNCRFEKPPAVTEVTFNDEATVKKVQAELTLVGYDCGTPDGKMGPKTLEALKAYQKANDLPEGNTITERLVDSLDREVSYQDVRKLIGPFLSSTVDFVERYNQAVEELNADGTGVELGRATIQETREGALVTEDDIAYLLPELNDAGDQILSCFSFSASSQFERDEVRRLSAALFAFDKSLESADQATDMVLRLLYEGILARDNIRMGVLPVDQRYMVWIYPAEE